MRYSFKERVMLAGELPPDEEVKILIVNLLNDEIVEITDDVCTESKHIPGLYLWDTNKLKEPMTVGDVNLVYKMYLTSDETIYCYGKIAVGGYINEIDDNITKTLDDLKEALKKLNLINIRI